MMASKTTYIPRYLLPQYGALWRTTTRSTAFQRPLNAELGQVLVRYASKTATPKKPAAPKTVKTPAAKVIAPKSASTKASSKTASGKAAKASAPTKPPTKATAIKPAATRAAAKAAASAPPPATEPVPATPAPEAVVKTETTSPTKPAATPAPVDPSKPLILEKPERFNPPSHGARLPRSTPKHYGGAMSDAELQAQTVKTYPGLPPPDNTWTHWFIHSRSIHLIITLGTLTSLAVYTFIGNFKAKSPFADMIPPISEFPRHPFQYVGVLVDVMRLHEEHESALTAEKRRRRVDDVSKRNEYRKAHGMEPAQGFWAKGTSEPESQPQAPEPVPVVEVLEPQAAPAAELTPDGKRKKFLGIF